MSDTTTGASADAIELLTSDHRAVEQLFRQFETAGTETDIARRTADEIVRELSIHAVIEEAVLYPRLRRAAPDSEEMVEHSLDEHQELEQLLASVDGKDVSDPAVRRAFQTIKTMVADHVQEEEHELFPALRRAIGQEELTEMGRRMAKAKALAPTHPHPNAPSTPPGNLIVGLAASVVDRVRDAARSG